MNTHQIKNWFFLLLALLPLGTIAQGRDAEKSTFALDEPGKPFKLTININQGAIQIFSHAGKEIQIEAKLVAPQDENQGTGRNQNTNVNINTNTNVNVNNSQVSRKPSKAGLLRISAAGNFVTIGQVNKNTALNIRVGIPNDHATLNLSINEKGNIHVKGVIGELELSANEGTIILQDISGTAIANTVKGNINASFRQLNDKAPMAFSTLTGDIYLSLPARVKARLNLKSDRSTINSDFFIKLNKAQGTPALMKTNQNTYTGKLAGSLTGGINEGGQEISIKNLQGNITIRKTK